MCPYKYYHVMRNSKDKKQWRYQMVQKALDHGIKFAARTFHTSPPVIRKWVHRFKTKGYSGLEDHSRRPHYFPNETSRNLKEHVIMLKGQYKRVGAEQIKVLEDVPLSTKTMRKIWRDAGIPSRKRRKKHVTKNNLREIKKEFKLFEQMGEDTKDLSDIPEYWLPMKTLNLPQWQYTFREISCGTVPGSLQESWLIGNGNSTRSGGRSGGTEPWARSGRCSGGGARPAWTPWSWRGRRWSPGAKAKSWRSTQLPVRRSGARTLTGGPGAWP